MFDCWTMMVMMMYSFEVVIFICLLFPTIICISLFEYALLLGFTRSVLFLDDGNNDDERVRKREREKIVMISVYMTAL